MADYTLDQVIQIVEALKPAERHILFRHFEAPYPTLPGYITLEALQREFQHRMASGAYENVESLRSKYAQPTKNLSAEELTASIKAVASEWEQEIDEFFGEN